MSSEPLRTSLADVGARVRKARLDARLAQQAVARAAGISESYLSRIETGNRMPVPMVAARLAAALHVETDYLLLGTAGQEEHEHTLLLQRGEMCLHTGAPEQALEIYRTLLANMAPGQDRMEMWADVEWGMARALETTGSYDAAIDTLEGLRDILPNGGQRWCEVLVALCRCYRETGDLAHAVDVGTDALAILDQQGLLGTEEGVKVTATLVAAHEARGDLTRARVLINQALARAEELGSTEARASAYWNASVLHRTSGRLSDAIRLADRALALMGETANERNLARLRVYCARLLLVHSPIDTSRALQLLDAARPLLRELGTQLDFAYCEVESARARLLRGDLARAETDIDAVLTSMADQAPTLEMTSALALSGQIALAKADCPAALRMLRQAAQMLHALGSSRAAASQWVELAELLDETGDIAGARDAYRAASACLGVVGVHPATHAERYAGQPVVPASPFGRGQCAPAIAANSSCQP